MLIGIQFVRFILHYFLRILTNCCQVWGQNGSYILNKILSLQRCALRIINFKPFRSDVTHLFHSLNIPSFPNLVRIANLLFVFDSLTHNLPPSIDKYFTLSQEIHSYHTRNAKNGKLVLPAFKCVKYGKYSIKYQCANEWNRSITQIINIFVEKYGSSFSIKSLLDLSRVQFKKLISKMIL